MGARGLGEELRGDYAALYHGRPAAPGWRGRLAIAARCLLNPSMQAVVLLRLCWRSPRWSALLWRQLLISRYAIDWALRPADAQPGLQLPHPVNIVIGPGVTLGRDVQICHNVSIGGDIDGGMPVLEDGVVVYPGAVIIGGLTIGAGSIVGANSFVNRDVPPGSMVKRDRVEPLRDSRFARLAAREALDDELGAQLDGAA